MNRKRTKKFIIIISILLIVIIVNILVKNFIIKKDIKAAKNDNELSVEVELSSIGVSILENGKVVAKRDYNNKTDGWDAIQEPLFEINMEKFQIGKKYPYNIQIENSGSIDEYVRIIFYKSWSDANGNRDYNVGTNVLEYELNVLIENGWICDESASTVEREVWYYENILPVGEKIDFSDYFRINGDIYSEYKINKDEYGNIRIESNYAGYQFFLEIEVDAVQTHNAKYAIKSAWGVDVNIDANGKLSLM